MIPGCLTALCVWNTYSIGQHSNEHTHVHAGGGGAFTAEKMGEWALPSPPGFGVNPGFREESKAVFGENDVSLRHQTIVFLKP